MIGWFGTETIGDRAILAGLLRVLSASYKEPIFLKIGSLFPPLTERTVLEDKPFYDEIAENGVSSIEVFNSLNRHLLKKNIRQSDLLFVGGGPLMDTPLMYMLYYSIKYAKSQGIKTAVLGCGWGPLQNDEYIGLTKKIVDISDVTIFRDTKSKDIYEKYGRTSKNAVGAIDPAIFAAQYFRRSTEKIESRIVCINLRELFVSETPQKGQFPFLYCKNLVERVVSDTNVDSVLLVPMHTYAIGGDDRIVLNEIAQTVNNEKVKVQNKPISLSETMSLYQSASYNIGMRFHSILLQTVLNGKNYVLDYTDPETGKIANLLEQLQVKMQYAERYSSWASLKELVTSTSVEQVVIHDNIIDYYMDLFVRMISQLQR